MLSERQQNPYHENSDYLKMHLTCTSMQVLGNIMSYFAYKILFVTHIFHLVYPGSISPFEFCDFYHNAISRAMCLCNCLKKKNMSIWKTLREMFFSRQLFHCLHSEKPFTASLKCLGLNMRAITH